VAGNLIIFIYCLLSLLNYSGSWFINDLSYGLRLIILALPLFIKINRPDKISLCLFAILLFCNIITILGDYQYIDKYDDAIYYPKFIMIMILTIYSAKKLKMHNK